MQTYSNFRPTAFDRHIAIEGRENWLVLSFTQTRNSEALERSNFREALKALGGEHDACEVHRFGHWGPGWFELILIDPNDEPTAKISYDLERAIEDYPILNEVDFSKLEFEELQDSWNSWQGKEFAEFLAHEFLIQEASRECLIHEVSRDKLFQLFMNKTNDYTSTRYSAHHYSREDIAQLLNEYRRTR